MPIQETCNAGSIPGLGRAPGGGHGNPLKYSCLENAHGQKESGSYSPWGHRELDTTEATEHTHGYLRKYDTLQSSLYFKESYDNFQILIFYLHFSLKLTLIRIHLWIFLNCTFNIVPTHVFHMYWNLTREEYPRNNNNNKKSVEQRDIVFNWLSYLLRKWKMPIPE